MLVRTPLARLVRRLVKNVKKIVVNWSIKILLARISFVACWKTGLKMNISKKLFDERPASVGTVVKLALSIRKLLVLAKGWYQNVPSKKLFVEMPAN